MNKSRYTLIIGFNKYEGFKAFLDNGDTETVTPRIEEPFKTKKEALSTGKSLIDTTVRYAYVWDSVKEEKEYIKEGDGPFTKTQKP